MNPVIVINAYKRPASLHRLLQSLQRAKIDTDTRIIFSIEYDADEQVKKMITAYEWPYGEKTIIQQTAKQGLIGHFLFCGDLTAQYGNIIYLEDDLFVGQDFYTYAKAVLSAYANEDHLAGFSLNVWCICNV